MKKINKRGFTLIEMLAVVVLLGLLIAFLFPAISKYIIQTKDETYTIYENDMEKSAKNMMSECVEKNDINCIPRNGYSKKITLTELISMGYSDKLRDPKNTDKDCNAFQSYVIVHNGEGNTVNLTYDVCLVCGEYESGYCDKNTHGGEPPVPPECSNEDDAAAPTCGEVTGGSTIWTNKDKIITVGCSDDCSGCVQDVFSKKIDTDTKETTIEIGDNSGKSTSCRVNAYVDKTKPECTLTIDGVLGTNGWYKEEPAPKVKITSKSDNLSGVATYGIGTSKLIYDFNKETEYEVKEGITTVYGYVMDNAGNVGTCSIEVKYDTSIPKVAKVDYGYVVYPKADVAAVTSNKIVTLNNIIGEYGKIYGIYIYTKSGYGAHATVKHNNVTLFPMTAPSSTSKVVHYFDTPQVYNSLTIEFDTATDLNNVSRIELLTRDGTSGYYTNQNVTLYVKSTDSVSGKAKYSFNGGLTLQNDNFKTYEKNTTVVVAVSDTSGNLSDPVTKPIDNIDKVVPQCSVTFGSDTVVTHDNGYYWENVPVHLARDDSNATTDYAKSGTRYYGLITGTSITYNGNDEGEQKLDTNSTTWYGYVIDRAGNTKSCNATVKKDSQNPECKLKLNGTTGDRDWYVSNTVDVIFDYDRDVDKNEVQSGLAAYDITGSTTPSYNNHDKQTQSADTTSVTYYGYVKDRSGRTNKCNITFKKDSTKPTCDIEATGDTGLNDWFTGDVTIKLIKTDETSKVNSYDLKEVEVESYGNHDTLTLKSDIASKTYYGYVKDNAGNKQNCRKTIKRDTTKPTCVLELEGSTINVESWYTGDVTVKWKSKTDATAGVKGFQIDTNSAHPGSQPSNYDGQNSKVHKTDTTTAGITYYGHVIDEAGLQNNCSILFKRDSVKPTCDFTIPTPGGENGWHVANVKLTLTKSDALSGINKYGINDYDSRVEVTQSTDTKGTNYTCKVQDKAGNEYSKTVTIKRDTVDPTCSVNLTGTEGASSWFRSDVNISLTKTDDTSGIAYYHLSGTSGRPSTDGGYNNKDSAKETSNQDRRYYYGYVKDSAGHKGSCSKQFGIDKVKPNCDINIYGNYGDNGWFVGDVKVTLSNHTDDRSGTSSYSLNNNASIDLLWHKTDTSSSGVTYSGVVNDTAGNQSTCNITFKRDTTPPTCGVTLTQNNSTAGVSGNVTCSDDSSGCVNGVVPFTNLTAPTGTGTGANKQEYSNNINTKDYGIYLIKDNAGHTNGCSVKVASYCRFKDGTNSQCGNLYEDYVMQCVRTVRSYAKYNRYCDRRPNQAFGTYAEEKLCTTSTCGYTGCSCSASGTYSTACTKSTCSKSGCTCYALCCDPIITGWACGYTGTGTWDRIACSLEGKTYFTMNDNPPSGYNLVTGSYSTACTTSTCNKTGCSCTVNGKFKTGNRLACTTDTCLKDGCTCAYSYYFEDIQIPGSFPVCDSDPAFECNAAKYTQSYLHCHPFYSYTVNRPSVPEITADCTETPRITDCNESTLGDSERHCDFYGYQSCRTPGNGCETYYYKYVSVSSAPGNNSGTEGGGGCHSTGAMEGPGCGGHLGPQACVIAC